MFGNFSYPYILSKKEDAIKLEIKARNSWILLLYLITIFLFIAQLLACIYAVIAFNWVHLRCYLIGGICIAITILILLFTFYMLSWKMRGNEIFVLYRDKLEIYIENKPFKTEKRTYFFSKLEIGYQSGEDFYTEEQAIILGVELDIEKVEGCYPIQFYMDEGTQVVDSERKIPIEAIRRIKEEYQKHLAYS